MSQYPLQGLAVAAFLLVLALPVGAQQAGAGPREGRSTRTTTPAQPKVVTHRVVVQITQNDPGLMNTALNNIENMARHYEAKKERLEVEVVAYGPGLHMMRTDTSPVKARLSALSKSQAGVTLTGCANSMAAQGKQEGQELSLVPEARLVPAGIARIVELQEQGWVYVRP